MQDDGCRFIANLTSISKLGAGRVGSVRLMAMPDGTSAALKQDFPGKNQQADFHREVRTQAMAGALAPLVLATSSVHERAASSNVSTFAHYAKRVNTSNKCHALQNTMHRSATQALLTRRQHHGTDPVALHGADPIEFLWATSATDEDRCVAHCFAAFAGRCKVGRTVNFTKYVERMPARWRAKDARAHGRA